MEDLSTAGNVIVDRIINTPAIIIQKDGMIRGSFCFHVDLVIGINMKLDAQK